MVAAARSMKDLLPDDRMVRRNDPQASRDAARSVTPYITDIQAKVLAKVREAGEYGITDYELETLLGNRGSTLRSRRAELVEKGLIKDTGQRRKVAGSNRTVWVAV